MAYPNRDAAVAAYGLDPRPKESGKFTGKRKLSKRGNLAARLSGRRQRRPHPRLAALFHDRCLLRTGPKNRLRGLRCLELQHPPSTPHCSEKKLTTQHP
ncbi:MAG: transposase [Gammaproteobacteria bacterium]